ncbi:uncharacterized protein LOC122756476 [Drosophila santomea]|uniref:uncharacterized protein LOC122756476 n=1 Tax=Drosophila santomea TaxID=129105 RepID=UPI001CC9D391|nr:uncharacterized protein LOC122756476 [Drosophila santomea]
MVKLFLESELVSTYEQLKNGEFKRASKSADVHAKLTHRKKKSDESMHEYMLTMKKMTALGQIDVESIIAYIVDGLDITSEFKFALYGSKSYNELLGKYELYESKCVIEKPQKQYSGGRKNITDGKSIRCYNCGSNEQMRKDCKAEKKCFKCAGSGYISLNCPQAVKSVQVVKDTKRLKVVLLNATEVACLVDTGSDVSIVCQSLYNKLQSTVMQKCYSVLRGLGSAKTQRLVSFMGRVHVDGIEAIQNFVVIPYNHIENDVILGFDFASQFCVTLNDGEFIFTKAPARPERAKVEPSMYNIVETGNNIDASPQYQPMIESMIAEYKPAENNTECPVSMKIVLEERTKPFRHQPSRHSAVESESIRKQVDVCLQDGIERKSSSNFASLVVVVKKKDGTDRICVDFRQLNSMVLKDCFPVPRMDDVLEQLQPANVFVVMDLENSFLHVPIEESSRKFTAFITKEMLFEFNRALYCFCNLIVLSVAYLKT